MDDNNMELNVFDLEMVSGGRDMTDAEELDLKRTLELLSKQYHNLINMNKISEARDLSKRVSDAKNEYYQLINKRSDRYSEVFFSKFYKNRL